MYCVFNKQVYKSKNNFNNAIFPNPASDLIAIQIGSLVKEAIAIELIDASGKLIERTAVKKGSSIAYFDIQTVYAGVYFVRFSLKNTARLTKKVIVKR